MARFSAAKDDIVSHGIGSGVYCGGRFARFGVRMHTHLSEVIRQHSPSIISRQDVQALLDGVKSEHPALVGELVPVLGHEVRHDRREIGARVRRKA